MYVREQQGKMRHPYVFSWECMCEWICVCLWLLQLCMPAFQAGHKSSLEMAGVCLCVVVHTFMCVFNCICSFRQADGSNCSFPCSTGCLIVTALMLCSTSFPRFLRPGTDTHAHTVDCLREGVTLHSDERLVDELCWESVYSTSI